MKKEHGGTTVAEPEIDEAAAVAFCEAWTSGRPIYRLAGPDVINLARAALRWKVNAEAEKRNSEFWKMECDIADRKVRRLVRALGVLSTELQRTSGWSV